MTFSFEDIFCINESEIDELSLKVFHYQYHNNLVYKQLGKNLIKTSIFPNKIFFTKK